MCGSDIINIFIDSLSFIHSTNIYSMSTEPLF